MKKRIVTILFMISVLAVGMMGCQNETTSGTSSETTPEADNQDRMVTAECSLCEIEKECGVYTVDGQDYVVCNDCYNEFACGMGLADGTVNEVDLESYMA